MKDIICDVINYFKCRKIIHRSISDEGFLNKLSATFGKTFKIDKLCRIYTVVNPLLEDIRSGGNVIIYEDSKPLINDYLLRNLSIIKGIIGENNFFDVFTYEIKKLDDDENYLLVLEPIFLQNTIKFFKAFSIIIIVITLVILLILIF